MTEAPYPGFIKRRITQPDEWFCSVDSYPSDSLVLCRPKQPRASHAGGRRGRVCGFSEASARRLRFLLRNLRPGLRWRAFVTLTYPDMEIDSVTSKIHLNRWLTALRKKYSGIAYLWVLELQQNGRPHYHILLDRRIDRHWLSLSWYRAVGSGDSRHLAAGTSVEAVRNSDKTGSYLVSKYLGKESQKRFEGHTGRVWGASRGLLAQPERFSCHGTWRQIAAMLRPMRRWLQRRAPRWRWTGGSFRLRCRPSGVEQLLAAGIASVRC